MPSLKRSKIGSDKVPVEDILAKLDSMDKMVKDIQSEPRSPLLRKTLSMPFHSSITCH